MKKFQIRRHRYSGPLIITLITIIFVIQLLTFIYKPWILTYTSQRLGPSETIYRHHSLILWSAVIITLLSWISIGPIQKKRYWYSKVILFLSILVVFIHYQMKVPTYLG